jgi:hypothetical protein
MSLVSACLTCLHRVKGIATMDLSIGDDSWPSLRRPREGDDYQDAGALTGLQLNLAKVGGTTFGRRHCCAMKESGQPSSQCHCQVPPKIVLQRRARDTPNSMGAKRRVSRG